MLIFVWKAILDDTNKRSLKLLRRHRKKKNWVAEFARYIEREKPIFTKVFGVLDLQVRRLCRKMKVSVKSWVKVVKRICDRVDEIDRHLIGYKVLPRLFVPESVAHDFCFLVAFIDAVKRQIAAIESQGVKPSAA